MIVKKLQEPKSEPEMRDPVQTAKRETELANLFYREIEELLRVVPDHISVEGPEVRLFLGRCERRLPVETLSSGLAVIRQGDRKRYRLPDWPFARQIRYLTRKGSRT